MSLYQIRGTKLSISWQLTRFYFLSVSQGLTLSTLKTNLAAISGWINLRITGDSDSVDKDKAVVPCFINCIILQLIQAAVCGLWTVFGQMMYCTYNVVHSMYSFLFWKLLLVYYATIKTTILWHNWKPVNVIIRSSGAMHYGTQHVSQSSVVTQT